MMPPGCHFLPILCICTHNTLTYQSCTVLLTGSTTDRITFSDIRDEYRKLNQQLVECSLEGPWANDMRCISYSRIFSLTPCDQMLRLSICIYIKSKTCTTIRSPLLRLQQTLTRISLAGFKQVHAYMALIDLKKILICKHYMFDLIYEAGSCKSNFYLFTFKIRSIRS